MDKGQMLSDVRAEISRLEQIEELLSGMQDGSAPSRQYTPTRSVASGQPKTGRVMSAEDRTRRSDAQKARWAKRKADAAASQPTLPDTIPQAPAPVEPAVTPLSHPIAPAFVSPPRQKPKRGEHAMSSNSEAAKEGDSQDKGNATTSDSAATVDGNKE